MELQGSKYNTLPCILLPRKDQKTPGGGLLFIISSVVFAFTVNEMIENFCVYVQVSYMGTM